jgi:predicted nucleotidyltransferase
MTELGLLAQQVGASERTLRRAVNEGTLRGVRPTPRMLRISSEEKRYICRSWRLLAALRSILRTEQNVRFALLFGSTASGTDTPASDIDLLVSMRDSSLDRLVELEHKLSTALGRPVDLTRLADAEADPALLAEAVVEGRVLIDREAVWPRLRGSEASLRRIGRRRDARRSRDALAAIDRLLAT